jgi:FkbM family methyltransferase
MVRMKAGSPHPNLLFKYLYRLRFLIRERLSVHVEISDDDRRYRFNCENLREYSRCVKMFIKEPGTCEWIKQYLTPGQVFYDIGANIGVYTVLAAFQTGTAGKVFAFEPHSGNFSRLLHNLQANNLTGMVHALNMALNDTPGIFPFHHVDIGSGQSDSQLDSGANHPEMSRPSAVSEFKFATSVDDLIESHRFDKPDHVKIDVDGNELLILTGMKRLFSGAGRPKTVQVEIHEATEADIVDFMQGFGFISLQTHYTRSKIKSRQRGQSVQYPYNNVFGTTAS